MREKEKNERTKKMADAASVTIAGFRYYLQKYFLMHIIGESEDMIRQEAWAVAGLLSSKHPMNKSTEGGDNHNSDGGGDEDEDEDEGCTSTDLNDWLAVKTIKARTQDPHIDDTFKLELAITLLNRLGGGDKLHIPLLLDTMPPDNPVINSIIYFSLSMGVHPDHIIAYLSSAYDVTLTQEELSTCREHYLFVSATMECRPIVTLWMSSTSSSSVSTFPP